MQNSPTDFTIFPVHHSSLILELLRLYLNDSRAVDLRHQTNLSSLGERCANERLTLVAHRIVSEGRLQLPRDVADELRQRTRLAFNNGAFLRRQAGVLDCLRRAGVNFAVLKGTAVGELAYPRAEDRESSDIDLWLSREDLIKAWSLLAEQGFHAVIPSTMSRWHNELHEKISTPDRLLRHKRDGRQALSRGGVEIDLHWDPRYRLINAEGAEFPVTFDPVAAAKMLSGPVQEQARFHAIFGLVHLAEKFRPQAIQLLDLSLLMQRYGLRIDQLVHHSALHACDRAREILRGYAELAQSVGDGEPVEFALWNAFMNDRDPLGRRFYSPSTATRLREMSNVFLQLSGADKVKYAFGALLPEPVAPGFAPYVAQIWRHNVGRLGGFFS